MGRTTTDDSRPPPWEPIEVVDKRASLLDLCGRVRRDLRVMCFDSHDRPCRTVEDLERVLDEDAFPVRVYPRQPIGRTGR